MAGAGYSRIPDDTKSSESGSGFMSIVKKNLKTDPNSFPRWSFAYNTGILLIIFVAMMGYNQEIVAMSMHWTETVGDKTAAHDKVFVIYENVENQSPVEMQESLSDVTGCWALPMMGTPMCNCIVRSHNDYTSNIALHGLVDSIEQRHHNASVIIDNCFSKVRSDQSISEKYLGTFGNSINIPTIVVFWNLVAFLCTFGICVVTQGASSFFYVVGGTIMTGISLVPLAYIPNNGIQILLVALFTVVYGSLVIMLKVGSGTEWSFHRNILFWPLYAVAFIVTGVMNNVYAYNRDYAFNVAYVLFGIAVAGLLCVGDYAVVICATEAEQHREFLKDVVGRTWYVLYPIC
jgi:hypothetical protein